MLIRARCMLVVVVSCAAQGFGIFESLQFAYDVAVRWTAVGCLLGAAAFLVFAELTCEYGRGAWNNASGTAVLLELARRFHANGLDQADLWLVATGSKEAGLNGMRHFMKTHKLDPVSTFFLNIDSVGAPRLHYVTAEGMLATFQSSKTLLAIAEPAAREFQATPVRHREFPSDALIPLARGFNALTLTSSYETPPEDRLLSDDTHLDVRDDALLAASGLAEDMWQVEIVAEKDEPTYQRIFDRYGIDPASFVMVGNSVKSDILPVLALGGRAVHIEYELTWEMELADAGTVGGTEVIAPDEGGAAQKRVGELLGGEHRAAARAGVEGDDRPAVAVGDIAEGLGGVRVAIAR